MTLEVTLKHGVGGGRGVTFISFKILKELMLVKFIYSEKATKFCKISTLLLSVCTVDKSKVEISQNFLAFSEYTNFTETKSISYESHNTQLLGARRTEVIIMRVPCQLNPPPAKQGWYQTLDYNPTLYLLGIDGFQCRSYCMHAELWHTTYCCTVADLASIFPNVKRFHCMCKLSTFLPFSTTWLSKMVKYQWLSCFYHPVSAYVLCTVPALL